jgi:hypothetical protein
LFLPIVLSNGGGALHSKALINSYTDW